MAVIINSNVDGTFTLNGTPYAKIYQPLAMGLWDIGIYNVNDTRQHLIVPTEYTEIVIDGSTYGSQALTMAAMLPVILRLESEADSLGGYDISQLLKSNEDDTAEGTITFLDGLISNTIQLSGGIGTQGTLSWNTDEETVDLIQNGATLQLGQETQVHVRNNSGVTITNGDIVMFTGTLGASGRLTVAKYVNDGSVHPENLVGIATESILNGEDGKVTTFGKIRQIQTDGINYGETWIDGDLLYASPSTAGALTNIKPSAPSMHIPIAVVVHSAANGTIFTRITVNHGIHDLHDVSLVGLADKDVLRWSTASSLWERHSSNDWDTAFGWGNHALGGYIKADGTIPLTADWNAGAFKITLNSTQLNPIAAPTHSEGLMWYDSTSKALSYYNDEADITVNVGQETLIRVRNTTGVTITNGQAVYISGATGASLPNVSLAKADAEATTEAIGLATHDIENNSNGYITILGEVNDLNTSAFTAGDELFLSETTAGALTNVAPTSGYRLRIGYVTVSNVSVGSIKVTVGTVPNLQSDIDNWNTAFSWGNHDGLYADVAHTHTFASLTSKPTTIGGYGITDFNSLGDARWLGIGATAVNSNLLDSLDSTQFLRSDANDNFTGDLYATVQGTSGLRFAYVSNASTPTFRTTGAYITGGSDYAGLSKLNNLAVETWYGFSVSPTISGQAVAQGTPAFSVNARTGNVYAATDFYVGTDKVLHVGNASTELTQFLRSDVADEKTFGALTFNDNIELKFGNAGGEARMLSNGTNLYCDLYNGDLLIRDNTTNRFTFGRTTGDLTASGSFINETSVKLQQFNGRVSSIEFVPTAIQYGSIRHDLVTSSVVGDTYDPTDGFVTTYFWDNAGRYDAQVFVPTETSQSMKWRVKFNTSAFEDWRTIIDTENVTTELTQFLRSDANDSTNGGVKTWFAGAISGQTGSGAAIQVNGFQRTGNIYLHEGGLTPTSTSGVIGNSTNKLQWNSSNVHYDYFNQTAYLGSVAIFSQDFSVSLGTLTTSGNALWTRVATVGGDGAAGVAKAGAITDNQSSTLQLIQAVTAGDIVQFDVKVSSEYNWDFLKVYENGVLKASFSGEYDWTTYQITVGTTGTRTFTWVYSKDGSAARGQDTVWVDNIKIFKVANALTTYGGITSYGDMNLNGGLNLKGNLSSTSTITAKKIRLNGATEYTDTSLIEGDVGSDLNWRYPAFFRWKNAANTKNFSVSSGGGTEASWFPMFACNNDNTTVPAFYFLGNSPTGLSATQAVITMEARINNAGTSSDSVKIWEVNSGYGSNRLKLTGAGNLTASNFMYAVDFKISSDRTLKTNIKDLEPKKIDVRWREFEFKANKGQKRLGVIAQELEENHPQFVDTSVDGTKSVSYTDLLIAKVAELESENNSLEARIERLEQLILNK